MISALCWVPKGVSKYVPEVAEPPSKEEIEEMVKGDLSDRSVLFFCLTNYSFWLCCMGHIMI
jgi:hypothetical protein